MHGRDREQFGKPSCPCRSSTAYEVGPGDEVTVHGAPTHVPFGEKVVARCHATVVRAGPLARLKAKIEGYLEFTELYEVSFLGRESVMIAMEGGEAPPTPAREWRRKTPS